MSTLDRFFCLTKNNTSVRTELVAGATTFLTMVYIIFVQPAVLSGSMLGSPTGMDFGAVTTATDVATDIAKGGVSSLGKLVGVDANKEMGGASGNIDDTDYCKFALAGRPLARAKEKPPPAALSSTSQPPPTQPRKPSSGDSTIDKLDRKLDEIDKGLGDALKGLFGK